MMNIAIVGGTSESLVNFRGHLISRMVRAGHKVTGLSAPTTAQRINNVLSLGAEFRDYPLDRNGFNLIRDMKTLIKLRCAYKEIDPEVVIAYTIKPVVWSGISMIGMKKPRFYALITGLGFAFQGKGVVRRVLTLVVSLLYRVSLRRATTAIFQNPDDLETFVSRNIIPREKACVVSGSGVDTSYFSLEREMPVTPVFLTIARLLAEKGIGVYADAARIVKRKYPEARFQILGPSDPSPDAIPIEVVLSWQEEGVVEYLGEANDVRPFISGCNVFVLASYYGEGLPRTILEAMSMGRPILTTDNVGCRETVEQNSNGLLIPVKNCEALANAMIWFIENPAERSKMGLCSRGMAEERFNVNVINSQMMRIMGLTESSGERL